MLPYSVSTTTGGRLDTAISFGTIADTEGIMTAGKVVVVDVVVVVVVTDAALRSTCGRNTRNWRRRRRSQIILFIR